MKSSDEIARAAEVLKAGGLVAFPTETVYGLGADASNDLAVAALYAAKGRPQFNPLISHVASLDAAVELGAFSAEALALARQFWPGPLTLVVPRSGHCPVSLLASAGLPSLALRMPAHDLALDLLREVGCPIVAPSANLSGRISPTTAQHVRDGLGDRVAMVLDGGACAVGVESTVVSFAEKGPRLLRPGGLAREEIERIIGPLADGSERGLPLHSPGQMESHYAPQARLRLNAIHPSADEIYLGFGQHAHGPYSLSLTGNLIEAAAQLFSLLHDIDARQPGCIAVAPIPSHGLGEAINDRLQRAAAPRPA
jgi:L-threonylcarbamoyladenylate synthase